MGNPVASDTFHPSPHYRKDAFHRGLERLGYLTGHPPKQSPAPHDVLLIWNRSLSNDMHARRYEAAGARVLVAENGFIGKDRRGHQLYALALGHHLGAGTWKEGPADRWAQLGIDLAPWRNGGEEIVILPQRGIGEPGVTMPKDWTGDVVRRIRAVTCRPVRVRPHPGRERTDPFEDLKNAWAAVTWASGAGIKALIAGVPMFHEMPSWIGAPAAKFGISDIESPFVGDRLPMLRRLAWAQWTVDEIESGEPFAWLLK
ncbi:hypothetical protein MesoLjLc_50760 [Mesorhizobium sp. L-8-10]|uniref:hypothetical protein n=1 Tax=Mesorhizobium sp. L-8-10 TaxID=2744523 RepID=UPI0019253E11|nr:hypothetical protein [Mesorhizobium sp. L-8-10]BCH33146.1 hypothetical protein MesoLjLc_50760 [Mesorhizobium sp. L-8-10]